MSAIIHISPLGFPWQTKDPFLFCAFHEDTYPPGNTDLGPDPTLLTGRNLGQDFQSKDGFRMYGGEFIFDDDSVFIANGNIEQVPLEKRKGLKNPKQY